MKILGRFLYHTAAYTTVVTALFFAFAKLMGVASNPAITFGRYALVFAFGLILSASEFVFSIPKLPKYAKYIIHYVALTVTFSVIFLTVRSSSGGYAFDAATVFAAVIIFSLFYAIGLPLVLLMKRALSENSEKSVKKQK